MTADSHNIEQNSLSTKEMECVRVALDAKLLAAKHRLDEIRKNGIPFESPISGFTGKFEWDEKTGKIIIQFLLMPIAFLLILFLMLLTPIAYITHIRDSYKKKQEISNEINNLKQSTQPYEVPKMKSLEFLWNLHGLDEYKYNTTERITVLKKWITVLYGEEIKSKLNFEARLDEITKRHAEANIPFYQGVEGAAHFHFMSSVDSLIRDLTNELPEYD